MTNRNQLQTKYYALFQKSYLFSGLEIRETIWWKFKKSRTLQVRNFQPRNFQPNTVPDLPWKVQKWKEGSRMSGGWSLKLKSRGWNVYQGPRRVEKGVSDRNPLTTKTASPKNRRKIYIFFLPRKVEKISSYVGHN